MNIGVVGVNHNLAPINVREAVSFTDTKKIEETPLLSGLKFFAIFIAPLALSPNTTSSIDSQPFEFTNTVSPFCSTLCNHRHNAALRTLPLLIS